MVSVKATCWHFNPWPILNETTEPVGPFGIMPLEPWHPREGAKLDHAIQLNCGEVQTIQVIKQPEYGRTSTTEEQKWSSFQMNYDN